MNPNTPSAQSSAQSAMNATEQQRQINVIDHAIAALGLNPISFAKHFAYYQFCRNMGINGGWQEFEEALQAAEQAFPRQ